MILERINKWPLSKLVILVFALNGLFMIPKNPNWQNRSIINWDISHYYSYLPATFIYHTYDFNDSTENWTNAHLRLIPIEGGGRSAKMTSGMAIMNLPFFLLAHLKAGWSSQYEQDAFSPPYQVALLYASLLYTLLGLWFMSKWLRIYLSEFATLLVVVSVYVGTNLSYYALYEPMSHSHSFALINVIIYLALRFIRIPGNVTSALLGLTAGLLILIRPTNILLLIFPLILALHQLRGSTPKLKWSHVLFFLLIVSLVQVPQLLYWKHMTGHWLVYSYPGERFFFGDPKIWQGLFSYRKGWFVYDPVLFFALPGLILMLRSKRPILLAVLATMIPSIWVIFSWWCWWYGGSFGMRALIEYLPIIALPLGFFYSWAIRRGPLTTVLTIACVGLLIGWHLQLMNNYRWGLLHHEGMTRELYWEQMNPLENQKDYYQRLDILSHEDAKQGIR